MSSSITSQETRLIDSDLCRGVTARALGLSLADRDSELIEYLRDTDEIPDSNELPSLESCVRLFQIEDRWASMVLDRVGQFMRKAARKGDYTEPYRKFIESNPSVLRGDDLPGNDLAGADLAWADSPAAASPAADSLTEPLQAKLRCLPFGTTFFIGDSNQDSRHWSANASYPILVGMHLQKLDRGDYLNAGVGGETAKQGLERWERSLAATMPVRTVIGFGGNDLGTRATSSEIVNTLKELIDRAKRLGSRVMLTGVGKPVLDRLWWLSSPPNTGFIARIDELNDAMRVLAENAGTDFLDIAAITNANDRCCDGIHFNQGGHDKLAIEILRTWAR